MRRYYSNCTPPTHPLSPFPSRSYWSLRCLLPCFPQQDGKATIKVDGVCLKIRLKDVLALHSLIQEFLHLIPSNSNYIFRSYLVSMILRAPLYIPLRVCCTKKKTKTLQRLHKQNEMKTGVWGERAIKARFRTMIKNYFRVSKCFISRSIL